jgi:hypothetical protein
MIAWIAAFLVFLLCLIFFWGSAPAWHFERLWIQRHGRPPPSDLMIAHGLLPKERRSKSASVFFLLAGVAVAACLLFAEMDYISFAALQIGAVVLALAAALLLHQFGPGAPRIGALFRRLDR